MMRNSHEYSAAPFAAHAAPTPPANASTTCRSGVSREPQRQHPTLITVRSNTPFRDFLA